MLIELSIRNFAIIDDISISFKDGLTVLTGETGAGKSIIIDAVTLLAGGRGSVEYVRYGEEKAEIVGLFQINEANKQIELICLNYGVDLKQDEHMITLERTITNQGKSICRVNGKIVTLTILREFGQAMINIHSQHDTIHLMDSKTHIGLLDLYQWDKILPTKTKYDEVFTKLSSLRQKYNTLNNNEQQIAHRMDLLQFQLTEIEQACLEENEDIIMTEERDQLHNYEKIFKSTNEAYEALYGDEKALEWLNVAKKALDNGSSHDTFIEEKSNALNNLYFNIEEITFDIRSYIDNLQFDENRLNKLESRLNEINRLGKKYGNSVADILLYKEKIASELIEVQDKDSHLEKLEHDIAICEEEALKIAHKLQKLRKVTAKKLINDIEIELDDLYLENATFDIAFKEFETLNSNGIDDIAFLLSTNKGEPLKEMQKVASGGELSRIMLALKKIFAMHDNIATVIFDEIDTGVSGRVAQAISEKMYQIANATQVLCITHLPQVAAMSDQHLQIAKIEKANRTTTKINQLSVDEKIKELAGMMTGKEITDTALEHSEQLLLLSTEFKNNA